MLALLLAFALPVSATCAPGFILSRGVTPEGRYTCTLWPRVDSDDVEPIATYTSRIHCRRGVPVVVSDHAVGCWRAPTTT